MQLSHQRGENEDLFRNRSRPSLHGQIPDSLKTIGGEPVQLQPIHMVSGSPKFLRDTTMFIFPTPKVYARPRVDRSWISIKRIELRTPSIIWSGVRVLSWVPMEGHGEFCLENTALPRQFMRASVRWIQRRLSPHEIPLPDLQTPSSLKPDGSSTVHVELA